MDTDFASSADIQYIPTYRDIEGEVREKTYPGEDVEFDWSEEDAVAYLNYWFSKNVLEPLGADEGYLPHTVTGGFDKLLKAFKKREKAKKNKKSTRSANKEISIITEALRKFIRVFTKNYYMMAPFLSGNYARCSIMYFTKDDGSRQRALKDAMLVNSESSVRKRQQYIFGQDYVLRQLEPNEIFRKDRGSIEARIEKIKGGITIENVASVNRHWKGGDIYYYGWRRVEMWGWSDIGGPGPYKPFQNALKVAMKECGDKEVGFSYKLHQEVEV